MTSAKASDSLQTSAATPSVRVVGVLTCFNRKPMTLACLEALHASAREANVDLQMIVVDDASSDGTAAAVRAGFPQVELIEGSGALFWNRGMHQGYGLAMQRPADYYLWINDDSHLVPDAIGRLLRQSVQLRQEQGKPVIVVGAMAERGSGRITYGGRVAGSSLRRFNYHMVWSPTEPMRCDVIEGNCVLIPREIALRVGNLDPVFEHAMGDTDYGLRAGRAGFGCFVSAGVIGYCSDNPVSGTHSDTSLPLRKRWRLLLGRKGLPVRSWLHFTRRHGGPLWPLYFSWPYARLLWSGLRGSRA